MSGSPRSNCNGRSSIADPSLPPDFSAFLRLLNTRAVDCLIRTFESTNVLSLVPLVTGCFDAAAEVKSLVEEYERPTLRLLVGIVLADERPDLLREQAADRRVALGREDL